MVALAGTLFILIELSQRGRARLLTTALKKGERITVLWPKLTVKKKGAHSENHKADAHHTHTRTRKKAM